MDVEIEQVLAKKKTQVVSASYTMGSMTVSGFANKVDNAGGTSGVSKEAKGVQRSVFILSFRILKQIKGPNLRAFFSKYFIPAKPVKFNNFKSFKFFALMPPGAILFPLNNS